VRLRLLSLLLPCLLLTACAAPEEVETRPKQYQATFLDVFDTVTTVMGYAESQEVFTETAEMAHDLLLEYHQLYDIYNDYEGIHNLKTVNDQAGIAPVISVFFPAWKSRSPVCRRSRFRPQEIASRSIPIYIKACFIVSTVRFCKYIKIFSQLTR